MPAHHISRLSRAIIAAIFGSAVLLVWVHSAAATVEDCRTAAVKVAGAFAKKRARQTVACALVGGCDESVLAAKKARLRSRSLQLLAAACHDVTPSALGLGDSCPDPNGRCTDRIDSPGALIDCMTCMVSETVDPLIRRLQGEAADVAQTCGGCAASECATGAYCEPPPGLCEHAPEVGICVDVPVACADEQTPVCACDGVTYQNDCVRRQHRVGLFHPGPCKLVCDIGAGDLCPEGTFCESLIGRCDDGSEGICVPVPGECHDTYEPVCGCDRQTYRNDCQRRAAGVRLLRFGPCQGGCGGDSAGGATGECGDDALYCELPPGSCGEDGASGDCIPRPPACTEQFDPVCGCDGVTYGNDCERARAGVAKLHDGACDDVCGGVAGIPCDEGEVCELPAAMCDTADLQGHCVRKPFGCPDFYDPVCGCDRVTYGNDCDRIAAGAQLDHDGACAEDCGESGGCEDGVCLPPPYHCDASADGKKCFPIPKTCPLSDAPFPLLAVCGCDGKTYDSACEAIQNGVQVAHDGPCDIDIRCTQDSDCKQEEHERCLPAPGLCLLMLSPLNPSICTAVPETCPPEDKPVCGCDLETYGSPCEANQAGTGVAYPGKCIGG